MHCPLLHVLAPSGAVQREEAIEIYTGYRKCLMSALGLARLYNAVRSVDRSRTWREAIYLAQKRFVAFTQVMPCSCMKLAACASMKLGTAAFERVATKSEEAVSFAEKFSFSSFIVDFHLNCRASMPPK